VVRERTGGYFLGKVMENEKSVPPDMSDFQPEMQIICFLPMFTLLLSD